MRAVGIFPPALELGLDDLVARNFLDQLGKRFSRRRHQLQHIGHSHQRISAGHNARIDHAAVAFAADYGVVLEHALNNVGFAYGCADYFSAVLGRHIVEHPARG